MSKLTKSKALHIWRSWAHCSLKSLNCSLLLSKPWFWERWRSLRQRAKRNEQTDKIKSPPYLTELGTSLFEIAQLLFAPWFWERWRSLRQRAKHNEQTDKIKSPLYLTELGTLLFEIAQLLFALEQTLILGVLALLKTKSQAQWANWQNQKPSIFDGAGHIALWNRSIALCSWANLDFGSDGAP